MKLLESLNHLPFFTLHSAAQLLDPALRPASLRTAIYRWLRSGKLIQLKRGVYMPLRFFERHRADALFAPAVSAVLLPNSYVSAEFILQRRGVLTDVTYPVSAVTTRNTRVVKNPIGVFSYRHIKPSLYTGYRILDYHGIPVPLATDARALFDYLYFRSWAAIKRSPDYNLAEELRLNLDDFLPEERAEFAGYVQLAGSPRMNWLLGLLRRQIWPT